VAGYACVLLVGLCVLWSSYGFRYQALPGAGALSPNDLLGANAGAPVARVIQFVQRLHVFPEAYTYGLADIVAEGQRDTFLLGKVYPRGQWFYFPAAFAIKSSVALLVSLAIAAAAAGLLYRGRRREMLFLLLPPLCFFAVSLTSGINIGVRHILPVYPFFAVVAAAGCCALARRRRAFAYPLAALLLFHAAAAARTAPHYIAFANDFWGGTDNTYRLLHDSNVDWGQSLKLADEYVGKEGTGDCWFAYFGPTALARENQRCHIMPAPLWTSAPEPLVEPVPPVIEGTLLVSAQALPPHYEAYEPLAGTKPVAILGGAVLVYRGRFELPLAAALSYSGRASQLARQGRGEEAVADGRRAVELAPDSPRTHMQLAQVLADTGRRDEARRELETVIHLAESGPPSFHTVGRRARQMLQRLR
jgi:hypothetical protein